MAHGRSTKVIEAFFLLALLCLSGTAQSNSPKSVAVAVEKVLKNEPGELIQLLVQSDSSGPIRQTQATLSALTFQKGAEKSASLLSEAFLKAAVLRSKRLQTLGLISEQLDLQKAVFETLVMRQRSLPFESTLQQLFQTPGTRGSLAALSMTSSAMDATGFSPEQWAQVVAAARGPEQVSALGFALRDPNRVGVKANRPWVLAALNHPDFSPKDVDKVLEGLRGDLGEVVAALPQSTVLNWSGEAKLVNRLTQFQHPVVKTQAFREAVVLQASNADVRSGVVERQLRQMGFFGDANALIKSARPTLPSDPRARQQLRASLLKAPSREVARYLWCPDTQEWMAYEVLPDHAMASRPELIETLIWASKDHPELKRHLRERFLSDPFWAHQIELFGRNTKNGYVNPVLESRSVTESQAKEILDYYYEGQRTFMVGNHAGEARGQCLKLALGALKD